MTPGQQPAARIKTDKTVLVTGGGGFLGAAIVQQLVASDFSVRSFSRRSHAALTQMGVEQIQGDLGDKDAVHNAVEGVGVVFHTAAKPPPWGRYADYFRTNTVGTENLIQACQRQDISALVHTSSPSVIFDGGDLEGVDESIPYPDRYLSHYAQTKALAEQCVLVAAKTGLPAVVLRPHEIWGPGDPHFVPRIIARASRLKRIGNGLNRVDTVYVDNAADAHLAAAAKLLEHPQLAGRIYFISQDEPMRAWEMIDAILNAAGLGPVKGQVPYRLAWTIGAVSEMLWRGLRLGGEPPMTRFVANALARSHWFDISAAKRDLGYRPAVSTSEGLRRLADWLNLNARKEETK